VYLDLHGRGYTVTPGHTYGTHYCVYTADPSQQHAPFLVRVLDQPVTGFMLAGMVRLATQVHKTVVLATVEWKQDGKPEGTQTSTSTSTSTDMTASDAVDTSSQRRLPLPACTIRYITVEWCPALSVSDPLLTRAEMIAAQVIPAPSTSPSSST